MNWAEKKTQVIKKENEKWKELYTISEVMMIIKEMYERKNENEIK